MPAPYFLFEVGSRGFFMQRKGRRELLCTVREHNMCTQSSVDSCCFEQIPPILPSNVCMCVSVYQQHCQHQQAHCEQLRFHRAFTVTADWLAGVSMLEVPSKICTPMPHNLIHHSQLTRGQCTGLQLLHCSEAYRRVHWVSEQ